MAEEALTGLSGRFEGLYAQMGRPSIPSETLLRAFFSVRSERTLMEQIDDDLLFRRFVGLEMDAAIWHPPVFTHTRQAGYALSQRCRERTEEVYGRVKTQAGPTFELRLLQNSVRQCHVYACEHVDGQGVCGR